MLGLGFLIYNQTVTNKSKTLHSEVIDLNDGYGYQIKVGNKIVILQEYIPGFPGKQKFASEEEALKTANLVLSKLKEGKSPVLSPSEMEKLDIATLVGH